MKFSEKHLSKLLNGIVVNRDTAAFEEFYHFFSKYIYSIAYSLCFDTQLSNDVMQEVFIEVYKTKKENLPSVNSLGWLYSVTKFIAYKMIKKERLARQAVESVVSTEPIEPDRSMYEIMFMDYLNVLSDDTEKQIVSLRILNDMQHKTIAKILDIPESTIRWKYKQALKKIKSSLKGDTNEK